MITKTILITGSSGFIGFNLAKKLLEQGNNVIGIDNENSDYDPVIKKSRRLKLLKFPNFQFLKMDIVYDDFSKVFKNKKIDYFVHLAAKDFYYDNPLDLKYSLYVESQVLGTARMFEFAKNLGAKKFILSSTHSVYGNTKKGLLTEKKIIPNPISPHGASKLAAEEVVRYMTNYYKLPAIILRISTVYGPGMTPHTLIPSVIRSLKNGTEVKQYADYGKTTRDFIYIDDVVNYIMSTLNKRIKFQAINIATGESITLSQIVKQITQVMGKKSKELKTVDVRSDYHPIIVDRVTIDISRAKKILRYTPETKLSDGLRNTIAYFTS